MTIKVDSRLEIISAYDNRTATALPAPMAHELATPIKVVNPTWEEVAHKAIACGYTMINMASAMAKTPMYRLIDSKTGMMVHQFSFICLADVSLWLDKASQELVDASSDIEIHHVDLPIDQVEAFLDSAAHTFNVGQTYEDASGLTFTVASRTGDTVKLSTEFTTVIRQVMVDDGGEFVRLGEMSKLYAVDTPSWFYDRDLHLDLAQITAREDRQADRALVFEPCLPAY